jgi:hypothetical protein
MQMGPWQAKASQQHGKVMGQGIGYKKGQMALN